MEDLHEGVWGTNGHAVWTAPQTACMLTYLANLVASGTKTCSGFKKVHLNSCAKAINEKFSTMKTGEQVKNHLKTWQRKFAKITRLRKLSAAGWDEINFRITLDDEHYNGYVQDHKADAEFLNKPLAHFSEMQTIFGNSMATGRFAKDSNSALGTEDANTENEDMAANVGGDMNGQGGSDMNANGESDATTLPTNHGATSSGSKTKKAKVSVDEDEEEGLIATINHVGDRLAQAIEKATAPPPPPPCNELPEDLFDMLVGLLGFEVTHISVYFQHLVANPDIGKAFYKLPFDHK